jgi:bifunctional non-homologous end joining protein LigD
VRFQSAAQSLGGRGGKRSAVEASFIDFHILFLDGHDLRRTDLDAIRCRAEEAEMTISIAQS